MAAMKREDTGQPAQTTQQKNNGDRCHVYIGPSFPHGKLSHGAILNGSRSEVEQYLADEIGKHPQVKALLVPITSLGEAKAMSEKAGTALNKVYNKLAEALGVEKR